MASISTVWPGRIASGTPANASAASAPAFLDPAARPHVPAVLLALSAQAAPDGATGLAKVLADQKADTDNALSKLEQARKSMISDRKAAAQEKLERVREALRMLRMLGGDPKVIAAQAKALARELQSAAREYGAALQAGAGADAAVAPTAIAPGSGDAAASTQGATLNGAVATPLAAQPAASSDVSANQKPTGVAQAAEKPSGLAAVGDADAVRTKALQAYQDRAAGQEAKAAENREIRQTMERFRETGREIKRLIEEAARKLKAQKPTDSDAQDAERAGNAMSREIEQLGKIVGEITGSSDAGGIDMSAASVPVSAATALDIMA